MILGFSDGDNLHNFCASHQSPWGMPIVAVIGSWALVENHQTKLCTWKLYDILVAPCQTHCHKPNTLENVRSSKFLFNKVQVFFYCVWAQYHQTPTDTFKRWDTKQQCGAASVSESAHHSPSNIGRTSAWTNARRTNHATAKPTTYRKQTTPITTSTNLSMRPPSCWRPLSRKLPNIQTASWRTEARDSETQEDHHHCGHWTVRKHWQNHTATTTCVTTLTLAPSTVNSTWPCPIGSLPPISVGKGLTVGKKTTRTITWAKRTDPCNLEHQL